MKNTILRQNQLKIEDLKQSKKFWSFWSKPQCFKNIIPTEFLTDIYNDVKDKLNPETIDFANRPYNIYPDIFLNIKNIIFPYIKKVYPWVEKDKIGGEIVKLVKPSNMHLDGTYWDINFHAKTLLIPIHIETDNLNYKWGGTIFFKQNYLFYGTYGYEWQLTNTLKDAIFGNKNFYNKFGKGYDKFDEFYDNEGNPLEHHNKFTMKDFEGMRYMTCRKLWLKGLDFENYFNWYPGDIISLNPYVIHAGMNFEKDKVKQKIAIRVRLFHSL